MPAYGLDDSFAHPENGMTKKDMIAAKGVADGLGEVIIFRSTGPWSRRWIEGGYPTKNFHVKGKSSDWGPQAGFVPYLGIYSKVGSSTEAAKKGTDYNDDGLKHKFADKVRLTLTLEELKRQATEPEEVPPRLAVYRMDPVPDSKDFFLFARRTGDNKEFVFRAVAHTGAAALYSIFVYPEGLGTNLKRLMFEKGAPLEVMTSSEVGAGNKPMTGDYDLMAVCPRWNDYGALSAAAITKPGLNFVSKGVQSPQSFQGRAAKPDESGEQPVGSRLDKVLDMRTNTGAPPRNRQDLDHTFQGRTKKSGDEEHKDMGNLTPRILRCINALNNAMERGAGALRRVHHNAESHRNHIFGGVVPQDAMPLTVFQPRSLSDGASPVRRYADVSTLETVAEFKEYVKALNDAGYFVPRSWLWGMSIRDTNNLQLPARKMPSGGPSADNAYQKQGQKWVPR